MFTLPPWARLNLLYIHQCFGCSDDVMFNMFYCWNGKVTERLARGLPEFLKLDELIAMTYICDISLH